MKKIILFLIAGVMALAGCDEEKEGCKTLPAQFDASTTLSGCYNAPVSPVITDGVTITMEPGTQITFAQDTGLDFAGTASLVAVGTAAKPILLTGAQKQRGAWIGVHFDAATSSANRMDYVTVEYAGSTTAENDPDAAAVKLTSDSSPVRLSLSHCTLRESQGWGLWVEGGTELPTFAANTLTANTLGAVNLDSALVQLLDDASSYAGNTQDRVLVRANQVGQNVTWPALDAPYYLEGSLMVESVWTLSPGTTMIMGPAAQITIAGDEAAMNAVGTTEEPIVITGHEATAGAWDAIVFDTTNNASNVLEYVTLEYGGGGEEQYDLAMIVAVSDSAGVTIDVANCILRDSLKYAIYLDSYASYNADIESGNTFSDNASGDVILVD
ncbi:hypothetical protein KKC22_20375 [Myxococcota bacterium]|nr:hypothetical protein [Myxococcota bacterium]